MLKRGSKSSYNPYSTSQRVKKAESKGKDRLDILPNKHNVWLKQVCWSVCMSSYVSNANVRGCFSVSCKIFALFVAASRPPWL